MTHLLRYRSRDVRPLPIAEHDGWRLKQYAILADGRAFSQDVARAATDAALTRLPAPGPLTDATGNHGVGFQLIHFAETAVMSPVFYWQWGSVLSNITQMRASWDAPTDFGPGVQEVSGCVWEMELVAFEVEAWKTTMLVEDGPPEERCTRYLNRMAG